MCLCDTNVACAEKKKGTSACTSGEGSIVNRTCNRRCEEWKWRLAWTSLARDSHIHSVYIHRWWGSWLDVDDAGPLSVFSNLSRNGTNSVECYQKRTSTLPLNVDSEFGKLQVASRVQQNYTLNRVDDLALLGLWNHPVLIRREGPKKKNIELGDSLLTFNDWNRFLSEMTQWGCEIFLRLEREVKLSDQAIFTHITSNAGPRHRGGSIESMAKKALINARLLLELQILEPESKKKKKT